MKRNSQCFVQETRFSLNAHVEGVVLGPYVAACASFYFFTTATASCIMSLLMIGDASKAPDLFAKSARVYVRYAASEVEKHFDFVMSASEEDLADYRKA